MRYYYSFTILKYGTISVQGKFGIGDVKSMEFSYQYGRAIIINKIIEMYIELHGDISDVEKEIKTELEMLNDYDLIKDLGITYELLNDK